MHAMCVKAYTNKVGNNFFKGEEEKDYKREKMKIP